ELQKHLQERFGWRIEDPGRTAHVTVHMQMLWNCLLLEVALLKQRRPILGAGWPFRGMGHVEAWAMAKSLDIQPGEVVLDPMCGRGTLLTEVALWWPHAPLIGYDIDPAQLEKSRANFHFLGRDAGHAARLTLELADAVAPGGLAKAGAVDKVLLAPPWNKQFAVDGDLEEFFRQMFREIFRVLKPTGRLVLLGARGQVEKKMLAALQLEQSGSEQMIWKVTARQRFALTPRVSGVILLIQQIKRQDPLLRAQRHLPWDVVSPLSPVQRWRLARAAHFPRLVPATAGDAETVEASRPRLRPHPLSFRRWGARLWQIFG
ncbi:THUMP domain-containing protein 2, partial [Durusdinium trenchii]